jgi:hypothetical protein
MDFPLILSGPILRRVEPALVSVWVALREKCSVQLALWEGHSIKDSSAERLFAPPPTIQPSEDKVDSIRIGEKLHLALIVLKLPADKALKPDQVYSYNLKLTDSSGATHDLKSLGLLKNAPINGKSNISLGYAENQLPSFALPPSQLTDLCVAHGSCRRIGNDLEDGLAWMDDLIKATFTDPKRRFHQLLLTGDQVYSDDVPQPLLPQLIARGNEMLAGKEFLPIYEPDRLKVKYFPADDRHFPPALRYDLIQSEGRFTTVDASHHLISFGEFAAMHLFVWCNALWDVAELKDFDDIIKKFSEQCKAGGLPETFGALFRRRNERNEAEIDDALLRKFVEFIFITLAPAEQKDVLQGKSDRKPAGLSAPELEKFNAFLDDLQIGGLYKREIDTRKQQAQAFFNALQKARRALANVPTYMVFDDHEVTDDLNLNPMWRDRVMTSPIGRATMRNGMLAYALFQGWGNDPEKFKQGNHKRLLDLAARLFAPASTAASQETINNELERMFGLNKRGFQTGDDFHITWNYSVRGPKHVVLAMDNRTQRSWLTRLGPPGNVTVPAIEPQIPAALPAGVEIAFVIASLPVLGPPVLDDIIAPLAYRSFDIAAQKDIKGMPGTNPDAIEAWAFDRATMEALLKRLAALRQVIILSGDVHYSSSQALSYWKKGVDQPSRILQFTSSGMKNVMPGYIRDVDVRLSTAQRIVRANIGIERLAWDKRGDHLQFPSGAFVVPTLRRKLEEEPVMIPTTGWPRGAVIKIFPQGGFVVAPTDGATASIAASVTTILFPDGGKFTLPPDRKSITLPDNTKLLLERDAKNVLSVKVEGTVASGENRLSSLPSGTKVCTRLNGIKIYLRQDGTMFFVRPNGTSVKDAPDWSWRIQVLLDARPDLDPRPNLDPRSDFERPKQARPKQLAADLKAPAVPPPPSPPKFAEFIEGYRQIAQRHADQFDKITHGRQLLFRNNFGVIEFKEENNPNGQGGFRHAIHKLYYRHPDDPVADVYTLHRTVIAALDGAVIDEEKPTIGGEQ